MSGSYVPVNNVTSSNGPHKVVFPTKCSGGTVDGKAAALAALPAAQLAAKMPPGGMAGGKDAAWRHSRRHSWRQRCRLAALPAAQLAAKMPPGGTVAALLAAKMPPRGTVAAHLAAKMPLAAKPGGMAARRQRCHLAA